MSIGSLGLIGSLASSSTMQRTVDIDRVERETVDQARAAQSEKRAETAAGIGEPEEEAAISDRDADGRLPWEFGEQAPKAEEPQAVDSPEPPAAKDPHGEAGNLLDISG